MARNIGESRTLGLRTDGAVDACGWNTHGQCDVQDWRDMAAVAAGCRFSVGLRRDGTVVAAGRCDSGALSR